MTTLNKKDGRKATPTGKPVKPKKPLPTKEEPTKVLVLRGLTEERVKEIVREEILNYMKNRSDIELSDTKLAK